MIKRGRPLKPENIEKALLLDKEVSRIPQVLLFYLFGSAAGGNMTTLSDLDFAVLFESGLSSEHSYELLCDLTEIIAETTETEEFDLVKINSAPLTMRYQIVRNGRILYAKREEARVDFEATTRSLFFDFAPLLKEYYRELYRKIEAGDSAWLTR